MDGANVLLTEILDKFNSLELILLLEGFNGYVSRFNNVP